MIVSTTPSLFMSTYNKNRLLMQHSLCVVIRSKKEKSQVIDVEEMSERINRLLAGRPRKQTPNDVRPSRHWKAVLNLQFDNIENAHPSRMLFDSGDAFQLFSEVLDKQLDVRDSPANIVIVCSEGRERSSAIALFFAQLRAKKLILDLKSHGWARINQHVFNTLKESYDQAAKQAGLPSYDQKVPLRD